MRRFLALSVALMASALFFGQSAQAQCGYGGGYYGGGYYGSGLGTGYYGGSGLSLSYSRYSYPGNSFSFGYNSGPSYGYSSYGYRSRGHYDYYPSTVVPHGNHAHVIPGHYHYHRGSHH